MSDFLQHKTTTDYENEWIRLNEVEVPVLEKLRDEAKDEALRSQYAQEIKDKKQRMDWLENRHLHQQSLQEMTVFSKEEKMIDAVPDLTEMKEAHSKKYEYRMKKKNIFKNEYECVPVQKEDDSILDMKQVNKDMLTKADSTMKDILNNTVKEIPMDIKTKLSNQTVMDLAAFGLAFGADMQKNVKKFTENEARKNDVIDTMTETIMSYDIGNIDLTSDSAIVQKSSQMETILNQITAYKRILKDNPEYVEDLKNNYRNKPRAQAGVYFTMYDVISDRISRLTDVTNYYRIRKCIIMDPTYAAHKNSDITMEINDTDERSVRHIKELLRASYILAKRLNTAKGNDAVFPELSNVLAETKAYQNRWDLIFDKKNKKDVDAGIEDEILRLENESAYVPTEDFE